MVGSVGIRMIGIGMVGSVGIRMIGTIQETSISFGIGISISRPLAQMMVSTEVRVSSIGIGMVGSVAIGKGVIGTVQETGIRISRPLAKVVAVGRDDNTLGHGIKSLGDGVQASAGAKRNCMIGIAKDTCISLHGSHQTSQQNKFHLVSS